MTEITVEQEIQDKGLTAPRITPEHIQSKIAKTEFHLFKNTCLTVCVLTLQNGFTVTGESACASPENFNKEIGERIAKENAVDKIWALEGYLLKERLHNQQQALTTVGKVPPGFSLYEGRTVYRKATQITEEGVVSELSDGRYSYTCGDTKVVFAAHEPVKTGDYIVYLTEKDTYHCNAKVFKERNYI